MSCYLLVSITYVALSFTYVAFDESLPLVWYLYADTGRLRYRKPTGADGDPGSTTTLGHVLNRYGNSPNKTVEDVLDIQGAFLCYEYVEA